MTAIEFGTRFDDTLMVVFGSMLFHHLARRWLLLSRRRTIEKDGGTDSVEHAARIREATRQSKQLLQTIVWTLVILWLCLIWVDMLPAIQFLRNFELWPTKETISTVIDGAGRLRQI